MFLGFLIGKGKDQHLIARDDMTSIGNILVDLGYITPEQLEEAITIQKSQKMLGEVLVEEMEAITPDQLDEALLEQQLRRKKIKRSEVLKLHDKKRRRLITKVNESAKQLTDASDKITMKMGEGLILLQTKVGQ